MRPRAEIASGRPEGDPRDRGWFRARLPWPGPLAIVSGATFTAAFALYRSGATRGIDHDVQVVVRSLHSGWLDQLGTLDDALFRATATVAAAFVLAIILFVVGPRWSWCAPLAIGVAILGEALVKNGWSQVLHPRALIDGVLVLFGGHYHAPASFPSGHVMRAIFLAVIAIAFLPRGVSIPFALLALTTPLARMYTESHRLTDVLGGATLGTCVACAAVWAVHALSAIEARYGHWRGATAWVARRVSARVRPFTTAPPRT
jgi:membrane-associated phospholipid phosphatase